MKKIYNAPVERIHNLNITEMIALSTQGDKEAESGYTPSAGGDGNNDTREQTIWDKQW